MNKPHLEFTRVDINAGWVTPFGSTQTAPFSSRYFLGGENQIRGFDIRTVGPTDSENRALGGNRFVLFNAEPGRTSESGLASGLPPVNGAMPAVAPVMKPRSRHAFFSYL